MWEEGTRIPHNTEVELGENIVMNVLLVCQEELVAVPTLKLVCRAL